MVKHRGPHNPAPDHDNSVMRFHAKSPNLLTSLSDEMITDCTTLSSLQFFRNCLNIFSELPNWSALTVMGILVISILHSGTERKRRKHHGFATVALALVLSAILSQPGYARDIAVLGDKTAKITVPDNQRCSSTVAFKMEASTATFYETRLVDFGSLFGAALNNFFAGCTTLTTVNLTGYVGKSKVIKASSKASDGWQLRLERPLFEDVAQSIPEKIASFQDLKKLNTLFDPHKTISGIAQTNGYRVFAQNAKTAVDRLTLGDPTAFETFATALLAKPKKTAAKELDEALAIVALYNPGEVSRLRGRYQALELAITRKELDNAIMAALTPEQSLKGAATAISKQLDARDYTPLQVETADTALAAWFEAAIQAHETKYPGEDLETAEAHVAFLEELSTVPSLDTLPAAQETLDDARLWFGDLVDEIVLDSLDIAEEILAETGTSYADTGLILETGFALSEEFDAYGFSEEAQLLNNNALTRAEAIIEQDLPGYSAQVAALDMTRDTIAELEAEAVTFAELSDDFETFAVYADVAEQAIISGRVRACAGHLQSAASDSDRDANILIEDRVLGLQNLACELYDNGHILHRFAGALVGSGAVMEIDIFDEGITPFAMELVDLGAETKAYEIVLTEDASVWADQFGALIIKPPTGKPDRNGVTECDLLAGDPADDALPSQGVNLETTPEDYDFDRAIDACIAAVEHDPQPRQVFQLARLLEFLGEGETAGPYLDAAAEAKYPPALHLKATYTLTYDEGDDAFFDAIDLYKEASAKGYAPAKKELSELIPPGTDLFRESPPPSDSAIMNVIDKRRCEGAAGFSVCATKTSVRSKKCFQTSATEFSCELTFGLKCSTGNHPLMQLFGGMVRNSCPSRTDPLFLKFTKSGDSWRYRNEF